MFVCGGKETRTFPVLAAALLHDASLAVVVARGALLGELLRITTTKSVLEAGHGTGRASPLTSTLVANIHLVEAIAQHLHTIAAVVGSIAVALHGKRA